MYMAFEWHTCWWHICGSSMAIKVAVCCFYGLLYAVILVCMVTAVVVQWGFCISCGRHICLGAYANNVKCVYASTCGDMIYILLMLLC